MIALIVSYLVLNLISAILGFKEGILYSRKGADAFKWDEHSLYGFERIVIAFAFYMATFLTGNQALALLVIWGFSFSFWHNGFYYISRHMTDVKLYHFTSSSTTSTAKIEFTWRVRLIMKIISVILFIIWFVVLPIRKERIKEQRMEFYKKQNKNVLNA